MRLSIKTLQIFRGDIPYNMEHVGCAMSCYLCRGSLMLIMELNSVGYIIILGEIYEDLHRLHLELRDAITFPLRFQILQTNYKYMH